MILEQTKLLVDDIKYWHNAKEMTIFEQSLRIHHRLVKIHPFVNGNGRHARLMADLILEKIFSATAFSWGGANLIKPGQTRKEYIDALRRADDHDYSLLLRFVRS